jgi:hypothetical protein|nr:MAG: hypothetical protein KatS3mg041_1144 [Bacteroidota bacterium]
MIALEEVPVPQPGSSVSPEQSIPSGSPAASQPRAAPPAAPELGVSPSRPGSPTGQVGYRIQPVLGEPLRQEARAGVSLLPGTVAGALFGAVIGAVLGYSIGQVGMIPVLGAIMITASFCAIGGMLGAMVGSLLGQSSSSAAARAGGVLTGTVVGGVVSAILGLLFPEIGPLLCGVLGAVSAGFGSWIGAAR